MQAISLVQFPINVDHTTGFGFSAHMTDLDTIDYILKDFWCEFLYVSVINQMRIDFSSLHGSRKGSYLLQHIRIKHIVIHTMCFGAYIRMAIMI